MADTSQFMAIGQVPNVDYGAIYERSKQQREITEQKKLDYLNQFQAERGSFAQGLQPELQKAWDAIESDLDNGDMSFKGRAKRQKMYGDYKNLAADALEYTAKINDFEASVTANPSDYNNPAELITQLGEARDIAIPLNQIQGFMTELPNPKDFRRYTVKEVAPNSVAGDILGKLKAGGGIDNFYNMAKTGALDPGAVTESVTTWFNGNNLSQEQEDEAIAFSMRQLGGLSDDYTDIDKVRGLSEDDRLKYLQQYAGYVTESLTNLLSDDIQTQKEKDDQAVRLVSRKESVKNRSTSGGSSAAKVGSGFQTGQLGYIPAYVTDANNVVTSDNKTKYKESLDPETGMVYADTDLFKNVSYATPTIVSRKGDNNIYTIESLAISSTGEPLVSLRYDQDVRGLRGNKKHTARVIVPWSEIQGEGIKGGKTAVNSIASTLQEMQEHWTENYLNEKETEGSAPTSESPVLGDVAFLNQGIDQYEGDEPAVVEETIEEETIEEEMVDLPADIDLSGVENSNQARTIAIGLAQDVTGDAWAGLAGREKRKITDKYQAAILADESVAGRLEAENNQEAVSDVENKVEKTNRYFEDILDVIMRDSDYQRSNTDPNYTEYIGQIKEKVFEDPEKPGLNKGPKYDSIRKLQLRIEKAMKDYTWDEYMESLYGKK
jgi:hypothetical protein